MTVTRTHVRPEARRRPGRDAKAERARASVAAALARIDAQKRFDPALAELPELELLEAATVLTSKA